MAVAACALRLVRGAVGHVALFLSDRVGHSRLIADVLVGLAAADYTVDGHGL